MEHISFEKDAVVAPLLRIGQTKAEFIDDTNKAPASSIDLNSFRKK